MALPQEVEVPIGRKFVTITYLVGALAQTPTGEK
jgi:hypothetical protein